MRAHSSRFCCHQSDCSIHAPFPLFPTGLPTVPTFLFVLPYSKAACAAAALSGGLVRDLAAASICKSAIRAPRRHAGATLDPRSPAGVYPSSLPLKPRVLTCSFFRVSFSSVSGWTGPLLLRTLSAHDSTRLPEHHKSSHIIPPISTPPAGPRLPCRRCRFRLLRVPSAYHQHHQFLWPLPYISPYPEAVGVSALHQSQRRSTASPPTPLHYQPTIC